MPLTRVDQAAPSPRLSSDGPRKMARHRLVGVTPLGAQEVIQPHATLADHVTIGAVESHKRRALSYASRAGLVKPLTDTKIPRAFFPLRRAGNRRPTGTDPLWSWETLGMTQSDDVAAGWTSLTFKSKFGAGRDFAVLDAEDRQVLFVDGKMGPTPKAEVRDASDAVVYRVKGQFMGIPKKMEITNAAGDSVASLKAKMFSPIKSKMTMSMADGSTWDVEGTIMEKNYTITSGGTPIAKISQKWMTVRDKYQVDFVSSLDPGLVMAVIWAIDRWVERD